MVSALASAAVVDEQRVTAELRRRDYIESLGVDLVAVAGKQELGVEGREPSEAGFVERLCVGLRLGLGEEFVVVLPENRALRGDGFEAVAMQMVCEFTCDRMEVVEVGVELVVAVVRPDDPTVASTLQGFV